MSDSWDFYFANVNDAVASLFVDLGIQKSAPDPERPWLLWTWVYFRQPRPDGLSSPEEAPALNDIEDRLVAAVREANGAELVGRITPAGRREFYFYGPRTPIFEEAVTRTLGSFPGYRFDAGTKEDSAWAHYFDVLYPSAEDWQRIQNRHVLEKLEKEGDRPAIPRPVHHWAYFKSDDGRARFVATAKGMGFSADTQDASEEADSEYPFGVMLARTDRVDWDTINHLTIELHRLAAALDGSYDGWETSVEKDS